MENDLVCRGRADSRNMAFLVPIPKTVIPITI